MKTIASLAQTIADAQTTPLSADATAALAVLLGVHGQVKLGHHGAAGSIYTFLRDTDSMRATDARTALYLASTRWS